MWLGIESGGDAVSVAVVRQGAAGNRVLAEASTMAPRSHTRLLMGTLAAALERAGVDGADALAIAVALGPGSYTGLRVGIATALGLAAAGGAATVGVQSLRLAAYGGARPGDGPIVPVLPAGRGGVYVQTFGWPAGAAGPVATAGPERLDRTALDDYVARAGEGSAGVRVVGPGRMPWPAGDPASAPAVRPFERLSAVDLVALAILDVEEESDGHGQAMALAPIYLRPAATPAGA